MESPSIILISLSLSFLSLLTAIGSAIFTGKNARASERKIIEEQKKWREEKEIDLKKSRLEFLRETVNGFTTHNWHFIENYDFPGVFPLLSTLKPAIPDKKDEKTRELFGQRVVTLSHLNILLRIFVYKDILETSDIDGYTQWANDWYAESKAAMRTILDTGDTYPLDFIVWLRDVIFKDQQDSLNSLIGVSLKARLRMYDQINHQN